jgi:hypothetical protein
MTPAVLDVSMLEAAVRIAATSPRATLAPATQRPVYVFALLGSID